MAHLNGLQALLRAKHRGEEGRLWSPVRQNNRVRLHQTPNAWGSPMTRNGVMDQTGTSVGNLAEAMATVIASARQIVDFTSLDPPRGRTENGVFMEAIAGGITELSRRGGGQKVRFLFGFPPASGRQPHHDRFKEALRRLVGRLDHPPTIVMGVYARLAPTGPYFNHAKIVASDAGGAVVGGHNLYEADYNQYPPVHDVSVEVWGPAAIDAQNFAAYLWEYGGISDPTVSVSESWNPFSSQGRQGLMSSLSNTARSVSNATQSTIVAWKLTKEAGWEPLSPAGYATLFPEGGYTRWDGRDEPRGGGYQRASILTVGRTGGWAHQAPGDRNASDYMKDYLFENAGQSIKISHQDLIAIPVGGMLNRVEHATCKALAAALHGNANLQVQVVVSAPYGCGRMDEYTNVPNGPQTAANFIMYYARGWFRGSNVASFALWKRLLVAPFHFTGGDNEPEGHYFWPQADEIEGCDGGLAKEGWPKSVGNHAKVMIVDDTTMVVGSDNHYPSPLAEINFVMEGEIVDEFVARYWRPLWRYSRPHAVEQWSGESMLGGE
jgi:phosphatidylserine/phosphatidylglycerophosphate/cardiolipin synthase-like enzyme